MFLINTKTKKQGAKLLRPTFLVALLGLAAPVLATNPTSGQLIIVNGLANVINGTPGNSASSVNVQVSDSTGVCSTTATLAYKGSVTVTWAAANTHSATSCTNITSVAVSALKTSTNTVQYDSTANSTPPATATAATSYTAPTTPITNLALIVTGSGTGSSTGSTTTWGISAGTAPVYSAGNGSLTTTGVMGGVGSQGLKAEAVMHRFDVAPVTAE
jgi:hypothetical protein